MDPIIRNPSCISHPRRQRPSRLLLADYPEPRRAPHYLLTVAGHDVVVSGVGMKERVPDRHDGWCLSNLRPGGDPFRDPP